MPLFSLLLLCAWALQGVAVAADPPTQAAAAAAPAASAPSIGHSDLLMRMREQRLVLLDVRTAEEFAAGHVPRAVNIAHDQLATRSAELPADKSTPIVVYCRSGRRSTLALEWLRSQGYTQLLHLQGDWLGWQAAGQPVEPTPASN